VRYYNFVISDPDTGTVWVTNPNSGLLTKTGARTASTFSSFVNGQTIAGALNVEFDFPTYAEYTAQGNALLTIWGVGLQMLNQATDLNQQNFALYAGMQKGLPLANPAQAGLIATGQIFQAFGNWQGTNQTLCFVLGPGTIDPSGGISFGWTPGSNSLSGALFSALAQAYPTFTVKVSIDPAIQPLVQQPANYDTLMAFSQFIQEITMQAGQKLYPNQGYSGVVISVRGNTIVCADSTVSQEPTQLLFQDLIGQPTWIAALEVSFKTVLRTDIHINDLVLFPQGVISPYALTSPAAATPNAPARSKVAFQGAFQIKEAHYFANFRQPEAESWNTTYVAYPAGLTPVP
jgi:hypothetical protein